MRRILPDVALAPLPRSETKWERLGGALLLSHGVKRSGGGWEGVVSNNGALSEAVVRLEG